MRDRGLKMVPWCRWCRGTSNRPRFNRIDPLYYLVDATRRGFTGHGESSTGLALAVTAIAGLAVFALAVAFVERGWRLKP